MFPSEIQKLLRESDKAVLQAGRYVTLARSPAERKMWEAWEQSFKLRAGSLRERMVIA